MDHKQFTGDKHTWHAVHRGPALSVNIGGVSGPWPSVHATQV